MIGLLPNNMENYRISIKDHGFTFMVDVLIWRHLPGGEIEMLGPDGEKTKLPTDGSYTQPTLRINQDFLPLLAEALNRKGIQLPEKAFTEGKLEAMTDHLSDMRRLVFEPGTETIINKQA